MPINERLFPEQERNEKVFLLLRRHWFVYVLFLLMALVLIAPLIVFSIYWFLNPDLVTFFVGNILIIVIGCYLLGILGLMLYGFIGFYLDIDIVTDRRVVNIDQKGFFKREISELNLHQIQDARAHVKGIFETMFHFGDVYIQTAGGRPNFTFHSIPNPYKVAKKIIDLNESAIESEEVEVLKKVKTDGDSEETIRDLTGGYLKEKKRYDAAKNLQGVDWTGEEGKIKEIESDLSVTEPASDERIVYEKKANAKDLHSDTLTEGKMEEGKEIDFE